MTQAGDVIAGRYQTVRLAGTGGFSQVWEARDLGLDGRTVAVKELSSSAAGTEEARQARALFHREIEALTSLRHDGLPTIFDGFVEGGSYYLVLEFVKGEPLESWRAHHVPSIQQVVSWGCEIADILAYLHGQPQPLVMRDLKPSNLILGEEGHLRLVDMGIAAILRPRSGVSATLAGFGTPGYASPEQYGRAEVDIRADLYALGATLYFLVAGFPPPDAIDRMFGRGTMEPLLGIRPETPPALARCVEGGLLAVEPSQRPTTAAAAAEWLRRSLLAPGEANPSAASLVRVHRFRAHEGRVLGLAFSGADTFLSVSPDDGVRHWRMAEPEPVQTCYLDCHRAIAVAHAARGGMAAVAGPENPIAVWNLADSAPSLRALDSRPGVTCVAFSPDGTLLAAGLWDKTVCLWEVAAGAKLLEMRGHAGAVASVAFSPDGRALASAASDRTVRLWNIANGFCVQEIQAHHGPVHAVSFAADTRSLVSASRDRTLVVWNTSGNVLLQRLRGHDEAVSCLAVFPDGVVLASASWDGTVRLWDAAAGRQIALSRVDDEPIGSLACSPRGDWLVGGSRSGMIHIWKLGR